MIINYRVLYFFLLALIFSLYNFSCVYAEEKKTEIQERIEVTDDLGNVLILKNPAQRVIALAPHIAEVVYAVGAGEALVGAVSYSNYPEAAKAIPRVGSYKSFSVESVLRLRPDLILAWHSGNGVEQIKKLEKFGLKIYWSDPKTLEDVSKSMLDIGILLAGKNRDESVKKFDEKLHSLKTRYSHRQIIDVFYQVWNSPLQTLNGSHLISDVMAICGGNNVFSDAIALAPKISVESVLRADPQVIIASGMAEERPEWLDEWKAWPQLQAVKQQQLHFIPPDLLQRHTPRILQGAAMMCEQLEQARIVYNI